MLCKFARRRGIVTLYKARKEGCVMNRSTKNMAKGVVVYKRQEENDDKGLALIIKGTGQRG